MRGFRLGAAVAFGLVGHSGAAWADGFYASLSGGAAWLEDADNEGSGLSA